MTVGVRLYSVNGKPGPSPYLGYGDPWDCALDVELLPGTYSLVVGYSSVSFNGGQRKDSWGVKQTITLVAEPGHAYVLDAAVGANSWTPALQDETTGKRLH